MKTLESHLTFIGTDESSGRLRCGFLTDLIDLCDLPICASLKDGVLTLTTPTQQNVQFVLPEAILAAIAIGAEFWVGNIGASEEAWKIEVTQG